MINLLPYDEIEKLGREHLGRFAVVAGLSLSGIVAIGLILLVPSYLFLLYEKRELGRELELTYRSLEMSEVDYIESEIANFNAALGIFEKNEREIRPVASILEKILSFRPDTMRFESIGYSRTKGERISVKGRVSSREVFLDFVARLETSGLFKKVDSPVSNLLREKDVDFSLILEIESP